MNTELLGLLRQRKVVVSAAVALVVLLIWVVAVFDPQGHKLSAVNAQVQQAQNEQASLQARLARLRLFSKESAQFEQLGQKLSTAVPDTTDVYDYITAISNAAAATGVKVSNVNPTTGQLGGNVAVVPVTVAVSGTYNQTLAFLKAIYALPRLTVVTQISISGGGEGTGRGTMLTDQFSLDILAQPAALAGSGTNR